mmetsp:Transcript_146035/g.468324  ORF Transcript_146035/g.468324 Transcript_146035/m.468324 type:complete len:224 (-) Transcript_146035:13-684(-)
MGAATSARVIRVIRVAARAGRLATGSVPRAVAWSSPPSLPASSAVLRTRMEAVVARAGNRETGPAPAAAPTSSHPRTPASSAARGNLETAAAVAEETTAPATAPATATVTATATAARRSCSSIGAVPNSQRARRHFAGCLCQLLLLYCRRIHTAQILCSRHAGAAMRLRAVGQKLSNVFLFDAIARICCLREVLIGMSRCNRSRNSTKNTSSLRVFDFAQLAV